MPESTKPTGVRRWLTTVDNRDIGVLYLVFGFATGLLGGIDALMLRTNLLSPRSGIWKTGTYDALFTMHGLTMLFLFATPVLFGLANYLVPALVGADEMAFPRVNAVAFWLLVPAAALIRAGILAELLGVPGVTPAATGWTLYVPLSAEMANPQIDLLLLGLHLSGVSTIMSAINFVVTVLVEREVAWPDLDIFSWTMLTTSGLVLFSFPVLGSALVMLLLDRNVGTTFFAVGGGGPLLWQHLFWFFGHPEVYILVLPPMGIVSLVLPRFAGRKLFGKPAVVYSTLAIGVLAYGVWAHHMFTTGIDPRIQASFMAVTLAIAVPSAVKAFNWIATLWNGRIRLVAPMLFCVGGVANFVLGGVTGVFLASIPVDRVLHGTYYVVGHFHFMLVGLSVFGLFAGVYYWFPLLTGRRYDESLARLHFWLTELGLVVAFGSMLLLGLDGLPRRMATYPPAYAPLQQVATVAAYVMALGQVLWLWNVVRSIRGGPVVEDPNVWDLDDRLRTPEWERFDRRRRNDDAERGGDDGGTDR
ncbi:cbb3-type cytochrome c oxidase subunit I [Halorussus vallis]|uniref:cytochrome c oxidase subunit I n=2 Tax=Halorussus TaxID=1070314 RepID=UPI00209E7EEF|nr:cbb3-type cytochrome c oxidase subunit I [Halorussus vallis]USZ74272.1 cbb3-type cytochrome c oxidase subunit I [Halorussus vallis]